MYASVVKRSLTDVAQWRVGYLCVERGRSFILRPSLFLFTLSGVLSIVFTLGYVPSITCVAVYFLNIYANVSNDFQY